MEKEAITMQKEMGSKKKQVRVSQNACPHHTLEEALKIPQAIKESFAGRPADPLLLAQACGYKPASSVWRTLTGSAIAYGLTDGGYNSKEITISPLGERVVSPLIEGDEVAALVEASLRPSVLNDFFTQYDRNKLPREDIAKNVLVSKGVPSERVDVVYDIIRANGRLTNTIQIISGSEYVRLADAKNEVVATSVGSEPALTTPSGYEAVEEVEELPPELAERMNLTKPAKNVANVSEAPAVPRVFISHGKNSKIIVEQLKELLTYGQMEPVISIEKETTAISVPEKVFDDMRSCIAGIIHVCPEPVTDIGASTMDRLNENVLIEIGAAMALYGKRIILLCQQGTKLPSNLQGLYRCEYVGEQLDYTSTMKLLKTLQELRKLM